MRWLRTIVVVAPVLLSACLSRPHESVDSSTDFEREIDSSLDGIDYRLRRLRSSDPSDRATERTLEELRQHRKELREELDHMIERKESRSDSTEADLRRRLEDLAIRYETARLGLFESRELFEQAVEVRFEDLDRELAVLEGLILQGELRDQFEERIARLYRQRNDVALRVAESAAASEDEFPRVKSELASAIGKLDIMLAHVTIEVDRAYEAKFPIRSLNKLWL